MYGGKRQALGTVKELLQRQDITQITTRQLDDASIRKIRELVAKSGSEVLSVDHPTDRLEALFLRVVGQAQREKLQTSGAESTVGVSQFLTGAEGGEVSLVESLVHAGRETPVEKGPAAGKGAEPVEVSPQVRSDLIASLTSEKLTPPAGPGAAGRTPAVAEPIESTLPDDPDRSVLERLVKPDKAKDKGKKD
jgi:hypothetical protein